MIEFGLRLSVMGISITLDVVSPKKNLPAFPREYHDDHSC